MELLGKIDGIDTIAALQRIGGDIVFYRKLLMHFVAEQTAAGIQVEPLLAAGDRASAKRIVHTTKGIAATIGADALMEAATVLEQAIRDSQENAEMLLRYTLTAAAAIAAIQQALPNEKISKLDPGC